LGRFEDTLTHDLVETAKLHGKQRGELAELAFMRKAAGLGFAVAKPWGDSDRYDVIVRFGKLFWRVQVKSVLTRLPSRNLYRVRLTGARKRCYSSEDIDFLVAYIFAKDVWYVFPVEVIENRESICLKPDSEKCRFIQYREAWGLMKPNPAVVIATVSIAEPPETAAAI
jgi:hypothetical protein